MNFRRSLTALFLAAALASPAFAQAPLTGKTTEQRARSYVMSAFMSGTAPMILSDDVIVTPELRQRLKLAPDAGSRAVYHELVQLTGGKALVVRPAIRDEAAKVQAHAEPGKPLFAVETGDETLVVQYDLERDMVSFVGQPDAPLMAVTMPAKEAAAPEQVSQALAEKPAEAAPAEKPAEVATPAPAPAPALVAEEPKPAPVAEEPKPAPVADEPKPAPVAEQPKPAPAAEEAKVAITPVQVVEPREPRGTRPLGPRGPQVQPVTLKRSGPCVIKPVMSDQDLVNCGATPRY